MRLVYLFSGVAVVASVLGLILATTRYWRGQLKRHTACFTMIAFVGLAVGAAAELVGADRWVSWVGIVLMGFAFYMLGRDRNTAALDANANALDPL